MDVFEYKVTPGEAVRIDQDEVRLAQYHGSLMIIRRPNVDGGICLCMCAGAMGRLHEPGSDPREPGAGPVGVGARRTTGLGRARAILADQEAQAILEECVVAR